MGAKISSGLNLRSLLDSEFKNPKTPRIIFTIAAIIAVFFLAFKPPTDPDLFWHLKTGELIWQYKTIPSADWYSYTMSDFGWINHEWLTEILMVKIKSIFGWTGLSVFFAAITAFIFIYLIPAISAKPEKKDYPFYVTFIITLLGAIVSSLVFGVRPQIFALLGVSLVFFILKRYQLSQYAEKQSKIIYALPILFLFWANMHASFAIGLGILFVCLVLDKHLSRITARNPKAEWLELYKPFSPELWKKAAYVGVLSFIATFINPYGPRVYIEIYRTFSDNYGTNAISEWLSPNFHTPEGMLFGFYLIFTFIILALIKKIDILSFVLIPLFLLFAFQAVRNIPLFVLITTPFLVRSLDGFENSFSGIMRKKIAAIGLGVLLVFYPPYLSGITDTIRSFSSEEKIAEIGSYPKKAIEFLKNYPAYYQKNILNEYSWGGYLIANSKWQIANGRTEGKTKVFIDGRMAHWKTGERHILKDYTEILLLDSNYQEMIKKYQIKIIFIKKEAVLNRVLSLDNKWKKIYADDIAIIYESE